MFSRLGPWCHDHRKLVLGVWIGPGPDRSNRRRRRVGEPRRVQPPDVESQARLRHPRRRLRRRRAPARSARSCSEAEQGVDDPEVKAAMEALFAEVAAIPDVVRVESPYGRGGGRQIASQGPTPARSPTPNVELPERHRRSPEPARSATRSNGERRRSTALRIELGGFIFAEFEDTVVRGARPRVRHHHPDPGVRVGAGHGPAGRRRPVRHRHRQRDRHPAQPTSSTVPDFATVPRDHDRPRRRHRLRAAHRHPLPRAAARTATTVRESVGDRHRHRRPLRALRRHHRRHLAARHAAHGRRASCRASPSAPPSVVAVTVVASLTLLPGPARLRRANGSSSPAGAASIAAGLVAVGLVGVGLKIAAARRVGFAARRSWCSSLGLLRARRSSARSRAARRSRAEQTIAYRWSRVIQHRPWPAAIGGAARAARSWPSRCSACGSASPTRATSPRTPPPGRPTTCSSTGFGPGFNGPLLLVAELPDGRRRSTALAARHRGGRAPTRASAFVSPADAQRPGQPDRGAAGSSCPTTGPQDEATTDSSTGCATTCCRRSRQADRRRRRSSPAASPPTSTSPTTSAARLPYFFGAVLIAVVPAADGRCSGRCSCRSRP